MKHVFVTIATLAAFSLAACDWQMPQEAAVKGSPEVWVPTGSTVFELDFLDDISDDFAQSMTDGASGFQAGEQPEGRDGYGDGDAFRLFAELTIDAPEFETP
ncbi:MAG: hypothetical protein R6V29_13780, partial [Spirochaetia bacterium]